MRRYITAPLQLTLLQKNKSRRIRHKNGYKNLFEYFAGKRLL
jgi:hypothetical protein